MQLRSEAAPEYLTGGTDGVERQAFNAPLAACPISFRFAVLRPLSCTFRTRPRAFPVAHGSLNELDSPLSQPFAH
jgi:hypothetical protein